MKGTVMTIDQIMLDGTAGILKVSASALQLAKDMLPPEQTADLNFDSVISGNREVAERLMAFSKKMDDEE